MNTKQVILIRSDIDIPVGKLAVQVAHASVNAILKKANNTTMKIMRNDDIEQSLVIPLDSELSNWLNGEYKKITLKVKNEKDLQKYYNKAKDLGLPCSYIIDNGHTVFTEPTATCVAIGPANEEIIDSITKRLRLY